MSKSMVRIAVVAGVSLILAIGFFYGLYLAVMYHIIMMMLGLNS